MTTHRAKPDGDVELRLILAHFERNHNRCVCEAASTIGLDVKNVPCRGFDPRTWDFGLVAIVRAVLHL